jgi:hypothetical protein
MGFLERLFGRKPAHPNPTSTGGAPPSFAQGDRVKDTWGNLGTVASVDTAAEHGLGRVIVKMDDGREVRVALIASGLERIS